MEWVLDPDASDDCVLDPDGDQWLVLVLDVFEPFPPEHAFCVCAASSFVPGIGSGQRFPLGPIASELFAASIDQSDEFAATSQVVAAFAADFATWQTGCCGDVRRCNK
jgi:hypothetical protein